MSDTENAAAATPRHKKFHGALQWMLVAAITFVIMEVSFRVFPQVLPLSVIAIFPDQERRALAERLNLPRAQQYRLLPRDDGGPELPIPKPEIRLKIMADEVDLALGAVTEHQMDSRGFCNPPARKRYKTSGGVVVLGDSFTWCVAVKPEDTWSSRLAKKTGRLVHNMSRTGIGPYEYIQLYLAFGADLKPDTVIMNIYHGNDLRDAIKYQNHRSPGRYPISRTKVPPLGFDFYSAARIARSGLRRIRQSPLRHSYAVNLIVGLASDALPEFHGQEDLRYRVRVLGKMVEMNNANQDVDELQHARLVASNETVLEAFRPAMERFASLARRDGFRAVVAYTPSAYSAYANSVEFADPQIAQELQSFGTRQREWLAAVCDKLGLEFVDTTLHFQRAAEHRPLMYFPANVHLTRDGHEDLADALAAIVR